MAVLLVVSDLVELDLYEVPDARLVWALAVAGTVSAKIVPRNKVASVMFVFISVSCLVYLYR